MNISNQDSKVKGLKALGIFVIGTIILFLVEADVNKAIIFPFSVLLFCLILVPIYILVLRLFGVKKPFALQFTKYCLYLVSISMIPKVAITVFAKYMIGNKSEQQSQVVDSVAFYYKSMPRLVEDLNKTYPKMIDSSTMILKAEFNPDDSTLGATYRIVLLEKNALDTNEIKPLLKEEMLRINPAVVQMLKYKMNYRGVFLDKNDDYFFTINFTPDDLKIGN